MISHIFVDELNALSSLTKASNLFAENGRGDQNVVVITNDTYLPDNIGIDLRSSKVQVIVKGWSYSNGFKLAEEIATKINATAGEKTYVNGGDTENYEVKSVAIDSLPIVFSDKSEKPVFSLNFTVFYTFSIT